MNNLVKTLCLLLLSNTVLAEDTKFDSDYIEQIVVVGSFEQNVVSSVATDFTFLESVMPTVSFTAGGYGGFAGFTERGTQTIHTTVFRNGIPVNDAGSGWYDFAHNVVTGLESLKVVSGPNSVLYGSGSLGGTVFINDTLSDQYLLRAGEDHALVNVTFLDSFSITHFDVNNGSVKTDNTERDQYQNTTIRFIEQFGDFEVASTYTDYDYDYDDCFTATFASSNDCLQSGTKTNLSIRNKNLTFGYSKNESEYFTEDDLTWSSDAERFYFDARENFAIGSPAADLVLGITFNKEKYTGESESDVSGYAMITFDDRFQLGTRVNDDAAVFRAGFEADGFFVNASTSFRNPTLYEKTGDAFVNSNHSLNPEEGFGWEIGYEGFSFFNYQFDENIDYDFVLNQFVNTGEYDTNGVRYQDAFAMPYGSFNVLLGYTDSDQPRVPEYKTRLSYFASVNDFNAELIYTAQFDRGIDTLGTQLEDIKSFDFVVSKNFSNGLTVLFTVQDMFDNVVEVLPGYNAGGRNFFLTLQYR